MYLYCEPFPYPLRFCEFGRAICKRKLEGKQPDVLYCGVIKDSQKETVAFIEEQVYNAWDISAAAPAKTRPRDPAQTPTLTCLAWVNGRPKFPDAVLNKFLDGTPQHGEIMKLKEQVLALFPASSDGAETMTAGSARAAGSPDFSGEQVLDLGRDVDLEDRKSVV